MAKATYPVVGGVLKKTKVPYVIVKGITKKVPKIYTVVKGLTKLAWQFQIASGKQVFTASTVWTVPDGVNSIDIFCVGGGGGGGGNYDQMVGDTTVTNDQGYGGGGGGGYTATKLKQAVTPGTQLVITVGAGGADGGYNFASTSGILDGKKGGTSSVSLNDTALCAANGGNGGAKNANANYVNGGNGGSGGGVGGSYYERSTASTGTYHAYYWYDSGKGGVDGANGARAEYYNALTEADGMYGTPGTGQGTTTKAFGEADGTPYSPGGNGNDASLYGAGGASGKKGTDGVVIIRW